MFKEITSDEEYYYYSKQYENAQININLAYNELRNISENQTDRITELQEYVDKHKTFCRGMFNLLSKYTAKKESKKTRIHIVDENDTLATIATLYYNDFTKWEDIYIENNLTSIYLEAGSQLIIPENNPSIKNVIYFSANITVRDEINIETGLDKVNKRG